MVAGELKEEPLCDAVRSRLLPHRGLNLVWPPLCLFWGPAARSAAQTDAARLQAPGLIRKCEAVRAQISG